MFKVPKGQVWFDCCLFLWPQFLSFLPFAHSGPTTLVLPLLEHNKLIPTKGVNLEALMASHNFLLHIPWIMLKFHISEKLCIAKLKYLSSLPAFLCHSTHHSQSYASYSFDFFIAHFSRKKKLKSVESRTLFALLTTLTSGTMTGTS